MEIKKSISVWLILKDGKNKGKIALQKRSSTETNFPFVCQATFAGKIEIGETIESAVKRECKEELGEFFYNNFDFSKLKLFLKSKYKMKKNYWEASNFVTKISEKILKTTKLHSGAMPKFIFIDKNDKIYPLSSGKNPKNDIVLFDDQYNVIKKIWQ